MDDWLEWKRAHTTNASAIQDQSAMQGDPNLYSRVLYCLSYLLPPLAVVIVCTDLRGKELHRLVGMGIVVKSGSPCGVMISTLDWKGRDVCSIPALGTIFPIFITPVIQVPVTRGARHSSDSRAPTCEGLDHPIDPAGFGLMQLYSVNSLLGYLDMTL